MAFSLNLRIQYSYTKFINTHIVTIFVAFYYITESPEQNRNRSVTEPPSPSVTKRPTSPSSPTLPASPVSPTKSPDYTIGNTSPKMPPPDPGNLLDSTSVTDYLSFHSNTESSTPEVCAGCVDALIVYAAEADKKKSMYQ